MAIDETFDVGSDTRSGVDDKDYKLPFHFTGKLDKLTIQTWAEPNDGRGAEGHGGNHRPSERLSERVTFAINS